MQLEVAQNPNCEGTDQFVFLELGEPRTVKAIRIERKGSEIVCEVTGVHLNGGWVAARCVKIADSGEGSAFLIYGGEWGLRFRESGEAWDLKAESQWGEPFKIYGSEEDIVYADR